MKYYIILIFALLIALPGFSQSRKELEDKRKRLLKEIGTTTELLNTTKKDRKAALGRLETLQAQISRRKELIETIRAELVFTVERIERNEDIIASLEDDIIRLKEDYAKMVRYAYRYKNTNQQLLYLFSADSFNDAARRWQYIKQYDAYRKKQAKLIIQTQNSLKTRNTDLEQQRVDKEQLLVDEEKQQGLLGKEMKDKNGIVKKLKSKESELTSSLKKKERARKHMNTAIEEVIFADIKKTKKKNRAAGAPARVTLTPAEGKLATNFKTNRGKLPWPVRKGVITGKYGTQPHPTLKKVKIKNNGIDIKTTPNAKVYAVFEGVVANVFFIPGYQNAVMVRHGDYYTVYSNLAETLVKRGQKIKTKQVVGKVGTNSTNGKTEVHFEIWNNKTRLNPTYWISK